MNTSSWNSSFSVMRSLACVAIVVLHTLTYSLVAAASQGPALSNEQMVGTALVQYSCMWAVPLFVMVTGALLLEPSRKVTWEKIWRKYIARIGGALLFFGVFFLLFDLVMNGAEETLNNSVFYAAHPAGTGYGYALLCGAIDLLTGHSWAHMWYLYMLLGLYLLLPFFKKVVDDSSEKSLRILIVVLLFFLSIVPFFGVAGITTDYRFPVATIYPLYLFLGYALHSGTVKVRQWLAWMVLVVSTAGIWITVWFLNDTATDTLSYFTSYNSLPVVLQAGSAFVLLDKVTEATSSASSHPAKSWLKKALLSFDSSSFGIYLIHLLFVKIAFRYIALQPFVYPWLFPVTILVVLLISWALTIGLKHVPWLNKIL